MTYQLFFNRLRKVCAIKVQVFSTCSRSSADELIQTDFDLLFKARSAAEKTSLFVQQLHHQAGGFSDRERIGQLMRERLPESCDQRI